MYLHGNWLDLDEKWLMDIGHRRRSSVNLGGRHFARKINV